MNLAEMIKILIEKGVDFTVKKDVNPPFGYILEFFDEGEERVTINSKTAFGTPGYIDFTVKPEGLPVQDLHKEVKEFDKKLKSLDPMFSVRITFGAAVYESDIFKYLQEIPGFKVELHNSLEKDLVIGEAPWGSEKYTFPVIPDVE